MEAYRAYQALAPFYDDLTAEHGHDRWLERLEALARAHGLAGRRVLDVACGTGASAAPLARRGYEVTACDGSPAMAAAARRRLAGRVFVADMRDLPDIGPFDLVTCLDDAVNYLLTRDDLGRAMRSFRRVLAPGGLLLFDVNSLHAYRTVCARDSVTESRGRLFCTRGHGRRRVVPGATVETAIEVFSPTRHGAWRRTTTVHRQRHHPREDIVQAASGAGLEILAVRGQLPGARLRPQADERRHTKVVYLAAPRETAAATQEVNMEYVRP